MQRSRIVMVKLCGLSHLMAVSFRNKIMGKSEGENNDQIRKKQFVKQFLMIGMSEDDLVWDTDEEAKLDLLVTEWWSNPATKMRMYTKS